MLGAGALFIDGLTNPSIEGLTNPGGGVNAPGGGVNAPGGADACKSAATGASVNTAAAAALAAAVVAAAAAAAAVAWLCDGTELGRSRPIWADLGRSRPIWAELGRSRPIWADLGRSREGRRRRCSSTIAPIYGRGGRVHALSTYGGEAAALLEHRRTYIWKGGRGHALSTYGGEAAALLEHHPADAVWP
jgi:hypothetical protein